MKYLAQVNDGIDKNRARSLESAPSPYLILVVVAELSDCKSYKLDGVNFRNNYQFRDGEN